MQYPSKPVRIVLAEEWKAKVIRQVATGEVEMAARNMLQHKNVEEVILRKVENMIQNECQDLCAKKNPSILRSTGPDHLVKLRDVQVHNELRDRAPTLHRFLRAAAFNKRAQRKKERVDGGRRNRVVGKNVRKDRSVPAVSMAGSLLLRCRSTEMSANAYRISALLWHAGAEKQVGIHHIIVASKKVKLHFVVWVNQIISKQF